MIRFILLAAFVVAVVVTLVVAAGTITAVAQAATAEDNRTMPVKFRRITYLLLLILMLGVTSGLLGVS